MNINNPEIKKIERGLINLGYKISSFNACYYYNNGKKFFGDIYTFYFVKNNIIFNISKYRGPSFVFRKDSLFNLGEIIYETFDVDDLLDFLKGYKYDL